MDKLLNRDNNDGRVDAEDKREPQYRTSNDGWNEEISSFRENEREFDGDDQFEEMLASLNRDEENAMVDERSYSSVSSSQADRYPYRDRDEAVEENRDAEDGVYADELESKSLRE